MFIFDLAGFSLKAATHTPTLEILRQLITLYEANYPETLAAAHVVNAPSLFQLVFRIVQVGGCSIISTKFITLLLKATVDQRTLSKIAGAQ